MEFKDKLKIRRKQLNLTQQEVADGVNVSRSVVAKWETGLVIPKDDMLQSLAEFLDTEIDDLRNDNIDQLLVSKNNNMRKKNVLIYLLITFIVIILNIVVISSTNRKYKNPVVVSLYFGEDVPCVNDIYYLGYNNKYELYFDILIDKKFYKSNPIFYVTSRLELDAEKPILLQEEDANNKELKLKYKVLVTPDGGFDRNVFIDIIWKTNEENNYGTACKMNVQNEFSINSSASNLVNLNFYYINKKIFTYRIEKGRNIKEVFKDNVNDENLINSLLNYELSFFNYEPFEIDANNLNLYEFNFSGWIREDGKSFDEPVISDINLYPDIPFIGDCISLSVANVSEYGLNDRYQTPYFHINGNRTDNINYKIYSDSEIVSIVDNKYKVLDYGIAEITVEYDLGFYKGVRTLTVERKQRK